MGCAGSVQEEALDLGIRGERSPSPAARTVYTGEPKLPPELQLYIIHQTLYAPSSDGDYTRRQDALRLARVCAQWREWTLEAQVRRPYITRLDQAERFLSLLNGHPRLQAQVSELFYTVGDEPEAKSDAPNASLILHAILTQCTNLKLLAGHVGYLTISELAMGQELQNLYLSSVYLANPDWSPFRPPFDMALFSLPRLVHLELRDPVMRGTAYLDIMNPQALPLLRSLVISSILPLSSAALASLIDFTRIAPQLVSLSLGDLPPPATPSIALLSSCTSLRILDLPAHMLHRILPASPGAAPSLLALPHTITHLRLGISFYDRIDPRSFETAGSFTRCYDYAEPLIARAIEEASQNSLRVIGLPEAVGWRGPTALASVERLMAHASSEGGRVRLLRDADWAVKIQGWRCVGTKEVEGRIKPAVRNDGQEDLMGWNYGLYD